MKSTYKVGDKVKVKENLIIDRFYGNVVLLESMAHLRGKEGTITRVYRSEYKNYYGPMYEIKELGNYEFTTRMLKKIDKENE